MGDVAGQGTDSAMDALDHVHRGPCKTISRSCPNGRYRLTTHPSKMCWRVWASGWSTLGLPKTSRSAPRAGR
eukprot:scaffold547_cov384-Prasinococcus_capsulatus_cf.AAC.44